MAKNGNSRDNSVCCSFCKKPQNLVRKLIAGPDNVFICDECMALCSEIVAEETYYEEKKSKKEKIRIFQKDLVAKPRIHGIVYISESPFEKYNIYFMEEK